MGCHWGMIDGNWRCGNTTCHNSSDSECAWFGWVRGPAPRNIPRVQEFDPFAPVPKEDVGFLSDSIFYLFGILVAIIVPARARAAPHPCPRAARACDTPS